MKNNMSYMLSYLPAAFETATVEPSGSAAPAAPEGEGGSNPGGPNSPPAESSTPSSAAPATPVAEPTYEIKVDGQTYKVANRDEAVALMQKGHNFTQKTQQLADERRRWEADRQSILEQEKTRWRQELAEQNRRAQEAAVTDPGQRALLQTQQLEAKIEDQALTIALDNIKKSHPDFNENEFLLACNSKGLRTAEDVARHGEAIAADLGKSNSERFESRFSDIVKKGEHPTLQQFKEQVIADYLKSKGNGPAPLGAAPGATPALGDGKKKLRNLDDASDAAIEILNAANRA